MPGTATTPKVEKTINDFLNEVGAFFGKQAEAESEVEGRSNGTTHPVKDEDDRLQDPKEGDRSRENSADVKEDQGALSVEAIPDMKSAAALLSRFAKKAEGSAANPPGTAAADQVNIGMSPKPTGEDPAHETESVKSEKEDPGSTHPARTDNDELDGHKYASELAAMSLPELVKHSAEIGNDLCASLTWAAQQSPAQPVKTAQTAPAVKPSTEAESAYKAGWELAGLVASESGVFDKAAADRMVKEALYTVLEAGVAHGHKAADYLDQFFAEKQAAELPPGGPPADAGALPPGGGGGDMMAALGGGTPPPAAAPAGPPAAGPGDQDGDEGGQLSIEELMSILESLGVTKEEVAELLQGGGGGGSPEAPPAAPPGGHEVAASDRTSAPRRPRAKAGNATDDTKALLTELLTRSRNAR